MSKTTAVTTDGRTTPNRIGLRISISGWLLLADAFDADNQPNLIAQGTHEMIHAEFAPLDFEYHLEAGTIPTPRVRPFARAFDGDG